MAKKKKNKNKNPKLMEAVTEWLVLGKHWSS